VKTKNIRNLFFDKLKESLKQSGVGGKLRWPLYVPGTYPDDNTEQAKTPHINFKIMPSPTFSETLYGREHTCYNGTVKLILKAYHVDDARVVLDSMIDLVASTFNTDMVLSEQRTDPEIEPFSTQIITPVSVSEMIQETDGGKWLISTCSMEYRSDVYTPDLRNPNTP